MAKLFKTQKDRYNRVARGAGVLVSDVKDLIAQHSKVAQAVKRLGGSKNLFTRNLPDMKQLQRMFS